LQLAGGGLEAPRGKPPARDGRRHSFQGETTMDMKREGVVRGLRVGLRRCAFAAAALAGACGGGGGGGDAESGNASVTVPPAAVPDAGTPVATDPTTSTQLSLTGQAPTATQAGNPVPTQWARQGAWGPVMTWPVLPIHAVLLPDGRLLTYGTEYGLKYSATPGREPSRANGEDVPVGPNPVNPAYTANTFRYDVWTPSAGTDLSASHLLLPNGTDVNAFCSAQLVLPQSGTVALFGGDTLSAENTGFTPAPDNYAYSWWANLTLGNRASLSFTPDTNALARTGDMALERWYATPTMLLNGEVLIQGGMKQYWKATSAAALSPGAFDAEAAGGVLAPEVRQINGSFRTLSNVSTNALDWYYPRNWVLPDGKVFGFDAWGRMYRIDAQGTGAIERLGTLDRSAWGISRTQSSVMVKPGLILGLGGGHSPNGALDSYVNGDRAFTLDVTGAAPVATLLPSRLSAQRIWVNATVLPTGLVVVTGGSSRYDASLSTTQVVAANPDPATQQQMDADKAMLDQLDPTRVPAHLVRQVDLWDPRTSAFTAGASERQPRLYHATATLLPDGTVLSAGGGTPGPRYGNDAQIYFPPYLFNADGSAAARPILKAAPASVAAGSTFTLDVADAANLARVTLVKTSAVTHSNNFDQRLVEPTFAKASATSLTVSLPAAGQTPPGYYLVFVIDKAGVPSLGKVLRIPAA
jgi:Domain of unknown function (DUF1929)